MEKKCYACQGGLYRDAQGEWQICPCQERKPRPLDNESRASRLNQLFADCPEDSTW